jgi:hypothetical protein
MTNPPQHTAPIPRVKKETAARERPPLMLLKPMGDNVIEIDSHLLHPLQDVVEIVDERRKNCASDHEHTPFAASKRRLWRSMMLHRILLSEEERMAAASG